MGVHGLWQLLQPTGRPVTLESLEGKVLAVDVSIWLHKTTKGMRGKDGSALPNAHLLGLFNRMCKLLFYNIKPIFVFDGGVPVLKRQTMTGRKQKANLAEAKSKKSTEKILTNYIQSQAIRKVIGKETGDTTPGLPQPSTSSGQDLFELPPIPEKSDSSDGDSDIDFSWEARMEQRQIIHSEFQDLQEIDVTSEDFITLPPEIRHEILTELKETRKRTHWCRAQDLPKESDNFSNYQMAKLMKQSRLSGQIETARREMNAQSIEGFAESLNGEGEIESRRILSRDASHVILVKGKNKRDGSQPWGSGTRKSSAPKIRSAETNLKKTNMLISFQMQPNFEGDTSTLQKSSGASESVTDAENKSESLSADPSTSKDTSSATRIGRVPSLQKSSSIAEIVDLDSDDSESDVEYMGKESAQRSLPGKQLAQSSSPGRQAVIQRTPPNVCKSRTAEKNVGESENVESSDGSDLEVLETTRTTFQLRRLQSGKVFLLKNGKAIRELPPQGSYKLKRMPCECRKCKNRFETVEIDSESDNSDIEVLSANISPIKCFRNNVVVQNLKHLPAEDSHTVIEIDDLSDVEETSGSRGAGACAQLSEVTVSETKSKGNSMVSADERINGAKKDEITSTNQTSPEKQTEGKSQSEENVSPTLDGTGGKQKFSSEDKVAQTSAVQEIPGPSSEQDRCSEKPEVVRTDQEVPRIAEDTKKTETSMTGKDGSSSKPKNIDLKETTPPDVNRGPEDSASAAVISDTSESESDGDDFIEVESDNQETEVAPSVVTEESQASKVMAEIIPSDSSHSSDVVAMETENVQTPNNIGEQFERLTQEDLEDMADDLEVEGERLRTDRAKQDRMARTITEQMYAEAQELLTLFGAPYIVSPMEAEAQCAYLDHSDQCDGSITEDSDIWLFGGQRVYKNFFNQDKHVEFFRFEAIRKQLALDRQKLINIALLSGCDYTDGIQGVGPVTATEILAEFPGDGYEGLKKFKTWWDEAQKQINIPTETKIKSHLRQLEIKPGFPSPAVVDAFLNPAVDMSDEAFSWGRPDLDLLREFAMKKFGWTKTRTDDMLLPVIKKLNEGRTQQTITKYFMPTYLDTETRKVKSKRLKRALNRVMAPQPEESAEVEQGDPGKERLEKAVSKAKEVLEREAGKRGGKRRKMDLVGEGGSKGGKGKRKKGGGQNKEGESLVAVGEGEMERDGGGSVVGKGKRKKGGQERKGQGNKEGESLVAVGEGEMEGECGSVVGKGKKVGGKKRKGQGAVAVGEGEVEQDGGSVVGKGKRKKGGQNKEGESLVAVGEGEMEQEGGVSVVGKGKRKKGGQKRKGQGLEAVGEGEMEREGVGSVVGKGKRKKGGQGRKGQGSEAVVEGEMEGEGGGSEVRGKRKKKVGPQSDAEGLAAVGEGEMEVGSSEGEGHEEGKSSGLVGGKRRGRKVQGVCREGGGFILEEEEGGDGVRGSFLKGKGRAKKGAKRGGKGATVEPGAGNEVSKRKGRTRKGIGQGVGEEQEEELEEDLEGDTSEHGESKKGTVKRGRKSRGIVLGELDGCPEDAQDLGLAVKKVKQRKRKMASPVEGIRDVDGSAVEESGGVEEQSVEEQSAEGRVEGEAPVTDGDEETKGKKTRKRGSGGKKDLEGESGSNALEVETGISKRLKRGKGAAAVKAVELSEGQSEEISGQDEVSEDEEPAKRGRGRGRGRGRVGQRGRGGKSARGKHKVESKEHVLNAVPGVDSVKGRGRGNRRGRGGTRGARVRGAGAWRNQPNVSMIKDQVDLSDKSSDEFDSDDDMLLSQVLDEVEKSQLEGRDDAGFVKGEQTSPYFESKSKRTRLGTGGKD